MMTRINVTSHQEIRTKVSGVTYPDPVSRLDRQKIIRKYVRPGQFLVARREPENPHGDHVVGLWVEVKGLLLKRRFHLGYINERHCKRVDEVLRLGRPVEVEVTAVTGGTREKPARGVNVVIRW